VKTERFSIGLIGYGRFGQLIAPHLARHVPVRVFDTRRKRSALSSRRIFRSSLREAASCPVVILAVPVSKLCPLLIAIAPFLQKNALVVDVCAVKSCPAEWMKKLLSRDVFLLGSHPLFGPQSAGSSLHGHAVVLCPLRLPERLMRKVRILLRQHGLRVITMTPRSHDRAISESLLITQYVGRFLGGAGMKRSKLSTPTFEGLFNIVGVAKSDSLQLFDDLLKFNPYTRRVINRLERSHRNFLSSISKR